MSLTGKQTLAFVTFVSNLSLLIFTRYLNGKAEGKFDFQHVYVLVQFVSTLVYYIVLSTCYKNKFKVDAEENARIEEAARMLVEVSNAERGESRADSLARQAQYGHRAGSNREVPLSESDILWFSKRTKVFCLETFNAGNPD